ncbi:dUTPase [Staphylococcus borealis]|uniref:dUTPase n=1 Tax=Staphylococcus borealis TaxID=2742203 RepID=UPI00265BD278|nr:dUTPase [Staphylococcus borealis]MDO0995401.1 dUTP diphosphatase [Staphylococcus borealis]
MTNTLTVDQLQELLKIQKEFDDRIPTLNLQDSKIAYVVEFFEWFNTLETFKNWKKKPGKPLDVQLDELADMLAFGLSIANQRYSVGESVLKYSVDSEINFPVNLDKCSSEQLLAGLDFVSEYRLEVQFAITLANHYYSIDQLIAAYKKKMERNHARQDGKADKDKGYV